MSKNYKITFLLIFMENVEICNVQKKVLIVSFTWPNLTNSIWLLKTAFAQNISQKNFGVPWGRLQQYLNFELFRVCADHLCLLWKIAVCYFLLAIKSFLFLKKVYVLLVVLTNNKPKICYLLKYTKF